MKVTLSFIRKNTLIRTSRTSTSGGSLSVHVAVRVLLCRVGGAQFSICMRLTGLLLGDHRHATWSPLWIGALGMVGIELIADAGLWLLGKPSVFGRAGAGTLGNRGQG